MDEVLLYNGIILNNDSHCFSRCIAKVPVCRAYHGSTVWYGLTITEYLRKRVLGYEPKSVPPDALFHFYARRIALAEQLFSLKMSTAILVLLQDISAELSKFSK